MVKITESLLRKRAEHNEGIIHSLEELALHQENIDKLEYIGNWCRELKILYLTGNFISKIENLSKLKHLEYLNLCMNNIEKIEGLAGCENLRKLDLTLNFIGEISSAKHLQENIHLNILFLTGNPCSNYKFYREFIILTLPQLKELDGKEIYTSERLQAHLVCNFKEIDQQEKEHLVLRKKMKEKNLCNSHIESDDDETFWSKTTAHTPEERIKIQKFLEQKNLTEKEKKPLCKKRKLFSNDGLPLNVNEGKFDFTFSSDLDSVSTLDLHLYQFLDANLINLNVQPNFIRVTVKGKIFQLRLLEEICMSKVVAKRSEITGHLLVTLPKLDADKIIRGGKDNFKSVSESRIKIPVSKLFDSEKKVHNNIENEKNSNIYYPDDTHVPPLESMT